MIFTTTLRQRETEDAARRQTAAVRRRRELRPPSSVAERNAGQPNGIDSRRALGMEEGSDMA